MACRRLATDDGGGKLRLCTGCPFSVNQTHITEAGARMLLYRIERAGVFIFSRV
jgi:hypothetical protein